MADDYQYNEPVYYHWVVGRYTGERAKSVLAHAHAGSGYYIMEEGRQGNQQWCLAASVWCEPNGPIPEHLTKVVDPFFIKKLENWRNPNRHEQPSKPADSKRIQEIKDMFGKRKYQPAEGQQVVDFSEPANA